MSYRVCVGIFCKNSIHQIKDWYFGLENQKVKPFRVFAVDGNSTDGTIDFLKAKKIEVYHLNDDSPQKAFIYMLKLFKEDIFVCSLSDEQMRPNAIDEALQFFQRNKDVDVLTRDINVHDAQTNKIHKASGRDFNRWNYMSGRYSPHFAATFFTKNAFLKINLQEHEWCLGNVGEFELWHKLASRCNIKYMPGVVATYTDRRDGQLSSNPENVLQGLNCKIELIKKLSNKKEIRRIESYFFISGLIKNTLGFVLGVLKKQKTHHWLFSAQEGVQTI